MSLLTKILVWKFNTNTFEQDFNAWKTVKAKYEQQTGQQLPDSVLVATMMNKTTGALQQHLRLNAGNITTFTQVSSVVASSIDTSWIMFDSGAAAHCCPKHFAPEWQTLPLKGSKPPLRSVTGQPLHVYGRKLVGLKAGEVNFFLHFFL